MANEEDEKRNYYFNQHRVEMLPFVPLDCKRILEVGCGEGYFAGEIKARQSCEIWGIEIDSGAAESARSRLDRVIVGDVNAVLQELPAGFFDCVVANDVLEHLVDHERALDLIRRVLAPGGILVASIPNFLYFDNLWNVVVRKQWRYEDQGILDKTHVRFFTRRSILDLLASRGYEMLQVVGLDRGFARRRLKYRALFFNAIFLNALRESLYLQYAVVARPRVPADSPTGSASARGPMNG